jgi:hypothetical protein
LTILNSVAKAKGISFLHNIGKITEEFNYNHSFSISRPYFLSLGDHVHRLFYDASGNNVEVKRYTRKLNYKTDPIQYSCSIWPKNLTSYQIRNVLFSFPALPNYNWNYLDHLISGYQDQMTDALRFWRIRFLLIPLETPPSSFLSNLGVEKLDEEEERLVGFARFMDMIEKARFISHEEKNKKSKKKNSLDIQLTTLNLSSLVATEDVHSLLPEAFLVNRNNPEDVALETLTKKSSTESIIQLILQPPPIGLSFQDRHWHFQVYENVITGEELINWILLQFSDIESRESAILIGNTLIDAKVIEHVKQTHKLLDGFYFYRLSAEWAGKARNTQPVRTTVHKRFQAVKQIALDLDPQKKSSRQEIALLHYDTTHNTSNCYHFQLHWLVCTARLIEDMLHSWTRMAEKCGFKLVEAPGGQVCGSLL